MSDFIPKEERERHRMRRRVLAEWRGIYEPPDLRRHERNISDVIGRVLKKAGHGERLLDEQVVGAWNEIVGPFLATHSRPVGLQRGLLTVSILQAAVRYDVERNHKRDILKRMQERFGRNVVREIRFQ